MNLAEHLRMTRGHAVARLEYAMQQVEVREKDLKDLRASIDADTKLIADIDALLPGIDAVKTEAA